uniref:phosphatidylinositol N-acetylglucosaminyltransferase subunit H isoform X1 n=1 Tax=Pristiophorus japonicus TaxID=55135 RepID=UPI00398E4D67
METKFKDINNRNITFEQLRHSPLCREFTVIAPKLSLRSVLVHTAAVWLAAYGIFWGTQNTSVLSAAIIMTLLGMILHLHLFKIDQESMLIIGSVGVQMNTLYASGRESVSFIEMKKVKDIVINEAIYMVRILAMPLSCEGSLSLSSGWRNWRFRSAIHWQKWSNGSRVNNGNLGRTFVEIWTKERNSRDEQRIIYYLCILLIDPGNPRGVSEVVPVFQSAKPRLDCLSQVYRSCHEILQQTRAEQ